MAMQFLKQLQTHEDIYQKQFFLQIQKAYKQHLQQLKETLNNAIRRVIDSQILPQLVKGKDLDMKKLALQHVDEMVKEIFTNQRQIVIERQVRTISQLKALIAVLKMQVQLGKKKGISQFKNHLNQNNSINQQKIKDGLEQQIKIIKKDLHNIQSSYTELKIQHNNLQKKLKNQYIQLCQHNKKISILQQEIRRLLQKYQQQQRKSGSLMIQLKKQQQSNNIQKQKKDSEIQLLRSKLRIFQGRQSQSQNQQQKKKQIQKLKQLSSKQQEEQIGNQKLKIQKQKSNNKYMNSYLTGNVKYPSSHNSSSINKKNIEHNSNSSLSNKNLNKNNSNTKLYDQIIQLQDQNLINSIQGQIGQTSLQRQDQQRRKHKIKDYNYLNLVKKQIMQQQKLLKRHMNSLQSDRAENSIKNKKDIKILDLEPKNTLENNKQYKNHKNNHKNNDKNEHKNTILQKNQQILSPVVQQQQHFNNRFQQIQNSFARQLAELREKMTKKRQIQQQRTSQYSPYMRILKHNAHQPIIRQSSAKRKQYQLIQSPNNRVTNNQLNYKYGSSMYGKTSPNRYKVIG